MSKPPRLWPAIVILVLAALWFAGVWLTGDSIRQYRILRTLTGGIVTLLALVLWLGLFSRLPWRRRLLGVGGVLLAVGLGVSLLRIRGVSGDLLPIMEPRWAKAELPSLPPAKGSGLESSHSPEPATPAPTATTVREPKTAADPRRPAAPEPVAAPPAPAAPAWPQYLGPNRDATLPGPRLARDWSSRPPKRVWRQPIGAGWSSFAVADGLAVTQEQRDGDELVVAYDFATGKPRWSHADKARYETVIAGVGPRATPTIAEGRVFAMGATGILNAFDLHTGRRLWSHQVVEENDATLPGWGQACSPLVLDGRVIVSTGGGNGRSLVAYDSATGERMWSGGRDHSSYSSPRLVTLLGRPQVVVFNEGTVAGHDPATGVVLWEQAFPKDQPNVAPPLPLPGDRLLVSAGYGIGSKVYAFAGQDDGTAVPSLVWESPRLKSKFANLILHDGFVYGLDDGVLTCLDPATGERRWKGGRYGHGQLLLVAALLLVQTEEGEIVLVEPTPEEHRELTRFPVLDGKTWNPPALSGARLLVRNDREAALYDLPVLE
jgi:outer membrane protein assembly factor BamB